MMFCPQCFSPKRCGTLGCERERNCPLPPAPYHGMKPPPRNGADVLGLNDSKAAAAIKANIKDALTREDVLKEAIEVTKARGLKYGQPEDNFARIARHWRVYFMNRYALDMNLGSRDVAMLMDFMKSSRLENELDHHDSWVDKAGYSGCGAAIREPVDPPCVMILRGCNYAIEGSKE